MSGFSTIAHIVGAIAFLNACILMGVAAIPIGVLYWEKEKFTTGHFLYQR